MHGISTENIQISEAAEILVYCLMDGKVDQKSAFECQLYEELRGQFNNFFEDGFLHVQYLAVILCRILTL